MAGVRPFLHTPNLSTATGPYPATARAPHVSHNPHMPEITDAQYREYQAYSALGTPEDLSKKTRDLDKIKDEAATRRKALGEAEKKIAELESKTPEGAVILAGDEAAAYEAVKAAGKTLKQVDADLKRLGELETKDKAREREDAVRAAAKAENLDPEKAVKAFANLAGSEALGFEAGEVAVQGKSDKQPAGYVVIDGKKTRLGEWLAAEHPYLNLAGEQNGNGGGVREVPVMRGGGGNPTPGSVFERIRESVKKETAGAAQPSAETLAKKLGGTTA